MTSSFCTPSDTEEEEEKPYVSPPSTTEREGGVERGGQLCGSPLHINSAPLPTVPNPPRDGLPANFLVLDESILLQSKKCRSLHLQGNELQKTGERGWERDEEEEDVDEDEDNCNNTYGKGKDVRSDWGQEEKIFQETRKFPPLLPLHLRYTPLNTPPTPFRCSSDGTMLVLDPDNSATRPAPEQLPCPLSVTIQHVYFQRREDHVVLGMTTRYRNKCATIVYYTTAANTSLH